MIFTKTYLEPKHFYRKIELIFALLEPGVPSRNTIENLASRFYAEFQDALNLRSVQIYERGFGRICNLYTEGASYNLAADILTLIEISPSELPWIDHWRGNV